LAEVAVEAGLEAGEALPPQAASTAASARPRANVGILLERAMSFPLMR
jgi:hypothetical protein